MHVCTECSGSELNAAGAAGVYALAAPAVVCCARMVRCQLDRALSGCGVDVRVFCVRACYTFLRMLCGVFGVFYWLVGIQL